MSTKSRRKNSIESQSSQASSTASLSSSSKKSLPKETNPAHKSAKKPSVNTSKKQTMSQTASQKKTKMLEKSQKNEKSQSSIMDFYGRNASQERGGRRKISDEDVLSLAQNTTFYIVCSDANKSGLTRAELQKNVLLNHPKSYPAVIVKANEILQEVFGFKLVPIDENTELMKCDKFIVVNTLSMPKTYELEHEEKAKKTLMIIILNYILLNEGKIIEDDIHNLLKALSIPANSNPEEGFGNITHRLAELKAQHYLKYVHDKSVDPPITYVHWGVRAKHEMNRKEMFKFLGKLYPDNCLKFLAGEDFANPSEEEENEEGEDEEEEEVGKGGSNSSEEDEEEEEESSESAEEEDTSSD